MILRGLPDSRLRTPTWPTKPWEKAIGGERRVHGDRVRKCAVCGKRIWSSQVVLPGRGSYHYECAENSGLLIDLDVEGEMRRISAELEKLTSELGGTTAHDKGAENRGRRAEHISEIVEYANSLGVVLMRRAERKREGR